MVASIILFIATILLSIITRLFLRAEIKGKVWNKYKSEKFIKNWYLWPFKERYNPVIYWGHLLSGWLNILSFILLTIFTLCSFTFGISLFFLIHTETCFISLFVFILMIATQKVENGSKVNFVCLIILLIILLISVIGLSLEIFGGVFGFWEI